jgi:hypothetical protein
MFLPFHTTELKNNTGLSQSTGGPAGKLQRSARETRQTSRVVSNQLGRANDPLASWSKAGCKFAKNRSFTDFILNNTPPSLGSNDS